ncbi:MAG: efflux RND transporter periplasmic adaptor subunit, partial [Longimicrobiales bacterium]
RVNSSPDLSGLRISRERGAPARHNSRRWKAFALAALALAVVLIAAVVLTRDPVLDVRTAVVAVRGGSGGSAGLTANGYVVARTQASVSSKLPGRLAYLGVEEGDRVAAGAVLARLEAAEYEANLRQAASQVLAAEAAQHEANAILAQAQRDLDRATALRADSLVAEQTLQDATTAWTMAQSRVHAAAARHEAARQGQAAARASLENTIVRAPFSGTILRKDAEVGEVVAPAVAGGGLTRGAVVTMADLSTLEVEVDVNEAYIAGVRDDQAADIVLDAYPAETFAGHVRQVMPTADRQKATVLVRVAIDSDDPRILPEMGARVVFRAATDTTQTAPLPARVTVPAAAVRSDAGTDFVWLVVDEHAQKHTIEAGPVMGDEREVRRGLSGGETVIIDAPADLADGARVRMADSTGRGS